MKKKISIIITAVFLSAAANTIARENVSSGPHKNPPPSVLAGCSATTAQKDLDINNVRARVLVGGDMWWDLVNAQYEIPKGSSKTSIFAGALWIGGIDAGGQIKVAAQTYRQTGNDMWAGPITLSSVSISSSRCLDFDKVWKIRKQDVLKYQADPGFDPSSPEEAETKQNILSWPGNGRTPAEDNFLAPFYDANNNGLYEPSLGDLPKFIEVFPKGSDYENVSQGIPKVVCDDYVFGDQTIWWVFNDVGNIHTETNSDPIGMEVRAQAFAFKTNDEINDMTFYKYQIINRSTYTLTQTYFGQWVDPDLGDANDDYVGCDVKRGLGYVYNADADDGGATGYGLNPPALGVDFFEGPKADVGDGIDNDRDGCTDCTYIIDESTGDSTQVSDADFPEQIIMAKFMYYRNVNNVPDGNPNGFAHFYNYLKGYWGDGIPMTHTCNGRDPGPPASFMYPGTTDPDNPSEISEVSCGTPAADGRMIQSAGAFTLTPGAVNYITTGVVWKKAGSGGQLASVELMRLADDKAQALFNNCFKLLDGPDAPDIVIRELDKEMIFSLQNTYNEKVELYSVKDVTIIDTTISDEAKKFKFQGYQVYQVKDATVAVSDLKNPDKARLLFQCDIKDTISRIINFTFDPAFNSTVPTEEVNGANTGITHTFKVDNDLFATGSTQLVNHKTYFYTAVSYAYNNYRQFYTDSVFLGGQQKPYLAGRNNIKIYSAIPHIITPENNGTILNSEYGDGPMIRRIEGQGNGGMVLDFTDETVNEILNSGINRTLHPEYTGGHGPIDVKVYDPILVKGLSFRNQFSGVGDNDRWTMTETGSNTVVQEDATISDSYEQIFSVDYKQPSPSDPSKPLVLNWGITANIHQVMGPGRPGSENNGFLEGTIEFADNSKRWLTGVQDVDGGTPENWVRSGLSAADPKDVPGDEEGVYESVINGTWAPFVLTSNAVIAGPKPLTIGSNIGLDTIYNYFSLYDTVRKGIESIDLIITSDQSKWSRAAVIELGDPPNTTIGSAKKFNLRKSPSIGKNGESDVSVSDTGMSWFPGYAYNLETGERLNIAFGENSSLTRDNSQNMKWDPTSRRYDELNNTVFGGMHYIYIFGHSGDHPDSDMPMYDQCQFIFTKLDSAAKATLGSAQQKLRKKVWKDAMWVSLPLLVSGQDLLSTEVKVRLRVAAGYRQYATVPVQRSDVLLNNGQTYYVASDTVIYNSDTIPVGTSFTANSTSTFHGGGTVTTQAPENGFNPMYIFSTFDLAPSLSNSQAAKDALKLVNVVPNPYYAYSAYEGNADVSGVAVNGQLDNRIKITNLPAKCTITIFTMQGTLIRRFERDLLPTNSNDANQTGEPDASLGGNLRETSLDWDLKNSVGITISSGIYLIHVNAPGIGERTLKWFGVLRPVDLDTF